MDERKPEDYNEETFYRMLEDARRTHREQLQAYNDVDDKRWRVLQFNGIIATVAMAGVVNLSEGIPVLVLVLIGVGALCLGVSTYYLLKGSPNQTAILGPSREKMTEIADMNPSPPVYCHWMTKQYLNWANTMEMRVNENSSIIDCAKYLSMSGVGCMISGALAFVTLNII